MKPINKTLVWTQPVVAASLWCGALGGAALFSSCAQAAPPDATALERIRAAAPAKAAARPLKARRILVYTRANGFSHSSRETGAEAMKILGEKTGAWSATLADSPEAFEDLSGYDAVIFLNTTGDALLPAGFGGLPDAEKAAARAREARYKANLLSFVNGGKGFVGIHSATDTYWQGEGAWKEYQTMIGGVFNQHPWGAGDPVTVRVEDPSSPIVSALNGAELSFNEEIYQMKEPYSRLNQRVVAGLNLDKSQPKSNLLRADRDYPVSWIKPQGAGRVFYCSLGHNEAMYQNPQVLGIYLAGIQYAVGDLKADASPLAQMPTQYTDVALGEYAAPISAAKNAPQVLVRIFPEGGDAYRAVLYWPDTAKAYRSNLERALNGRRVEMTGTLKDNVIEFTGKDGEAEIKGTWIDSRNVTVGRQRAPVLRLTQLSPAMEGQKGQGNGAQTRLELSGMTRSSLTLLAPPPPGAIALIPYERDNPFVGGGAPFLETDAALSRTSKQKREAGPSMSEWKNQNWIPMRDGSVQVNGGDNFSTREFGDIKMHVEFMTPLKPEARGQERGNSGVYLQERYEVQVLDSFGLDQQDNDAGGLYKTSKPLVNAGLPPGQWQTYDITFRAPRLYTDGSVQKLGRITVALNGVVIQDNVEVPHQTGGGAEGFAAKAPIKLQDHGNPVRYRNMWVQELKDQPNTPIANPNPNAAQKVLFDGKSLDAWSWGEGKAAPAIEDGAIAINGGGDVWSRDEYDNFVLDLEWKVDPGANSGVFIRNPKPGDWYAGMEIQVLDSFGHNPPDVHDAGANYDVQAPSKNAAKPAGQWNTMRVTARDQNIVVELNGEKVLDQDLSRWTEAGKNPDGSGNKFKAAYKDMPRRGHIELQDHDKARAWYRNIRVREIK